MENIHRFYLSLSVILRSVNQLYSGLNVGNQYILYKSKIYLLGHLLMSQEIDNLYTSVHTPLTYHQFLFLVIPAFVDG